MVKDLSRGKIVIYKTQKGPELEVVLENVYKENELDEKLTIRKSRIVQTEGRRRIEREVELYNLDMILSVGYRVSSKRATQFRIWATKTLKNYLVKGYVVNEKRLLQAESRFNERCERCRTSIIFDRMSDIYHVLF